MRSVTRAVAILLTTACLNPAAWSKVLASEIVGVRHLAAPSPSRDAPIAVTVWYPADRGGRRVIMGESPFFVGTAAMLDASISPGAYPVIVLSHGAGLAGNAEALSWIAMPLAKQGFIVAAPTHPGNTGPNRSAAETMKLWLRPRDLTATLDAVTKDGFLGDHLAPDGVGALGLSMGGGTALMIAGARLDQQRLAAYCDVIGRNPSLCQWVKQSGVDLHAMDLRPADRDFADSRVRVIVSVDPVPSDVFDRSTLSRIEASTTIINLGKPDQIPPTILGSEIASRIPNASYDTITAASHYSMFAECKPHAAEIAKEENIDEPICSDGGGSSRSQIHAQLIEKVAAVFKRALNTAR